jgi:hypothetical protein
MSREPHPALSNAIYLLGCQFARASTYCAALEPVFLQRTETEISNALSNSDRLVDIVQASCLLAIYFFSNSRSLDGYCQAYSAARLAMGLGLHLLENNELQQPSRHYDSYLGATPSFTDIPSFPHISTPFPPPASTPAAAIPLPPPLNAEELQDRISTLWMAFVIDRCWSVASNLPVTLPPAEDIKTPWPSHPSASESMSTSISLTPSPGPLVRNNR